MSLPVFDPLLDDLCRVAILRSNDPSGGPVGPSLADLRAGEADEYAGALRFESFISSYWSARERSRHVASELDLTWPPTESDPVDRTSWTVWPASWCWWPGMASDGRWIVYPHDWRQNETEPDLWGFGHLWTSGRVLAVPSMCAPAGPPHHGRLDVIPGLVTDV